MSIFSRTRTQEWQPAWTWQAPGLIWLLKFSGDGSIVMEVRDPALKRASFVCLDEATGDVRWQDLALGEAWWVGIEDISAGILYLHGYRKPDMPQHLGITAVGLHTGTVIWENRDETFQFVFDGRVYVASQRLEGMHYEALDAATGMFIADLGNDPTALHAMREVLNSEDRFAGYRYPEPFDTQHPDYTRLRALIEKNVRMDLVRGPLDVLATDALVLASWHEHAGTGQDGQPVLDQHFAAFGAADGRCAYASCINTGVAMPTIDSFFVKDGSVYYIANGCILTAHVLPNVSAS